MSTRDPRIDPQPFDEVASAKGTRRKVVYITLMDQVIYDPVSKSGKVGSQQLCELKTWRRWAKDGEVVNCHQHRGSNASSSDRSMRTNFHITGQLTLIGNEIMSAANRKSQRSPEGPTIAITCTPTQHLMQVLFEMGLAAYWKDRHFQRRVDAEVERRASK